ncbi:YybH family protein [Roseibium aggregatum]|uniref:SgcJ/EcaC family oxidoreductase n=1 Tax=Roseibium aggregatum TaxID=187304 RepID=A0A939EEU6_9HYPH|nr:SgcJ/EcaC family oxidoreductase [Roseibium aggregatum]MBN9670853.1 SgcJ/EcaC family oxidoreductase [Roseibium aggregatum]
MAAFVKAYNAQDAAAVSTFYTDKAALLPPRSKALVGRQAIANHYAQAFQNGVEALIYQVIEIDQAGPGSAVEIGETRVKFKAQSIAGRSIHVWKNVNGEWFIHRDMYHVLAISE